MNKLNEGQEKVLAYGLAYLLNKAESLANGMAENLPESEAMTPNQVVLTLDQLVLMNRDLFDRWGLGTYIDKDLGET